MESSNERDLKAVMALLAAWDSYRLISCFELLSQLRAFLFGILNYVGRSS